MRTNSANAKRSVELHRSLPLESPAYFMMQPRATGAIERQKAFGLLLGL